MTTDGPRTLLLIDDHPVFHDGLAAILSAKREGWRLKGAHSVARGLEVLAETDDLDMVLIDLMMPDLDGFEAMVMFGEAAPEVPRVAISGREDVAARQRAQRSGASGFIAKSSGGDAIVRLIERVLNGESGFDDLPGGGGESETMPVLTPRQIDVLSLLAEGLSNKAIEHRLNIAERTVRSHLTEVFAALGAHSRTQAILKAQRLGIIP